MKSEIETMEINGEEVSFAVKELGHNYGDPTRNGTIVELAHKEGNLLSLDDDAFCRLSDGDAGKVALYVFHQKDKAADAAAVAYLSNLFPGMEICLYLPGIDDKHPSPPVLYEFGMGPSKDGKFLYVNNRRWSLSEEYHFKERWNMVHRYWTSYNMCKKYGVKFRLEYVSSSNVGIPQAICVPFGKMIRVQDAHFDENIKDGDYFDMLFDLIDQLKDE